MAARLRRRDDGGVNDEEVTVRLLGFLFGTTKREHFLERYLLREHKRGRPLAEILDDAYVRNRWTEAERARVLERPEVVAAIGEHAVADLRLSLAGAPSAR